MGDMEGATEILQEIIKEGSDEQIEEASKLLGSLDGKSG
jgi:FimV-like protein